MSEMTDVHLDVRWDHSRHFLYACASIKISAFLFVKTTSYLIGALTLSHLKKMT